MDSIVHVENERFVGRTNFRSGLLNSMVALSVNDVEGVTRLCPEGFPVRRLFSRAVRSGVDVIFFDDGVVVEACVKVRYGESAGQVCYRVQENVITVLESMIEDRVKNVNVKIFDVEMENDKKLIGEAKTKSGKRK